MSFPASFVKLNDGTWGVRLPVTYEPVKAGDNVFITTRAGDSKSVTLAAPQGKNRYGDRLWSLVPQEKPAPAQAQAVGDLGGVLALFTRAKIAGLKKPAIVLAVPKADKPEEVLAVVHLSIASARAKVPGSVDVKDNENFEDGDWGPRRVWLGRVVEGQYQPGRAANGRSEAIAASCAASPASLPRSPRKAPRSSG